MFGEVESPPALTPYAVPVAINGATLWTLDANSYKKKKLTGECEAQNL